MILLVALSGEVTACFVFIFLIAIHTSLNASFAAISLLHLVAAASKTDLKCARLSVLEAASFCSCCLRHIARDCGAAAASQSNNTSINTLCNSKRNSGKRDKATQRNKYSRKGIRVLLQSLLLWEFLSLAALQRLRVFGFENNVAHLESCSSWRKASICSSNRCIWRSCCCCCCPVGCSCSRRCPLLYRLLKQLLCADGVGISRSCRGTTAPSEPAADVAATGVTEAPAGQAFGAFVARGASWLLRETL